MPNNTYTPGSYTFPLAGVSDLAITIRSADESGPDGGEGGYAELFIADPTIEGDASLAIAVSAANAKVSTTLAWNVSGLLIAVNDGGFDGPGIGGYLGVDDWGAATTNTPGADNAIADAGADGSITLTWTASSTPDPARSKYMKLKLLGII
jgi:hypothetical protein